MLAFLAYQMDDICIYLKTGGLISVTFFAVFWLNYYQRILRNASYIRL